VLEAHTPQGRYTVWLDPARGFQMAKAILQRQPGHQRATGYTLIRGESDLSRVDRVRFAKSGDVWVPVEAAGALENVFAGGTRSAFRFQLKVTKFRLNPDPVTLGSFLPDDIRNGSAVYAVGRTNANGSLIRDEWRDGHGVDKTGKVVFRPNG
jgi:hypothetical protein